LELYRAARGAERGVISLLACLLISIPHLHTFTCAVTSQAAASITKGCPQTCQGTLCLHLRTHACLPPGCVPTPHPSNGRPHAQLAHILAFSSRKYNSSYHEDSPVYSRPLRNCIRNLCVCNRNCYFNCLQPVPTVTATAQAPQASAATNTDVADVVTLTRADLAALREEIRQDVAAQFDRFRLEFVDSKAPLHFAPSQRHLPLLLSVAQPSLVKWRHSGKNTVAALMQALPLSCCSTTQGTGTPALHRCLKAVWPPATGPAGLKQSPAVAAVCRCQQSYQWYRNSNRSNRITRSRRRIQLHGFGCLPALTHMVEHNITGLRFSAKVPYMFFNRRTCCFPVDSTIFVSNYF